MYGKKPHLLIRIATVIFGTEQRLGENIDSSNRPLFERNWTRWLKRRMCSANYVRLAEIGNINWVAVGFQKETALGDIHQLLTGAADVVPINKRPIGRIEHRTGQYPHVISAVKFASVDLYRRQINPPSVEMLQNETLSFPSLPPPPKSVVPLPRTWQKMSVASEEEKLPMMMRASRVWNKNKS